MTQRRITFNVILDKLVSDSAQPFFLFNHIEDPFTVKRVVLKSYRLYGNVNPINRAVLLRVLNSNFTLGSTVYNNPNDTAPTFESRDVMVPLYPPGGAATHGCDAVIYDGPEVRLQKTEMRLVDPGRRLDAFTDFSHLTLSFEADIVF